MNRARTVKRSRAPRRWLVGLSGGVTVGAAAAAALLLLALQAASGAQTGPIRGPTYSWRQSDATQSAWLDAAHVVVFLKRGIPAQSVAPRLAEKAANMPAGASPAPARTVGAQRLLLQVAPVKNAEAPARLAQARAALLADPAVADVGLVFYQGVAKPASRLVSTGEVLARFRSSATGQDQVRLCAQLGLHRLHAFAAVPGAWLLKASAPLDVFAAADALSRSSLVSWAVPCWYRPVAKRAIPNDLPNDRLFPQQWTLLNSGQNHGAARIDADITGVWDQFRGDGSVIAIADDGLQVAHPDLAANVVPSAAATGSYDWIDHDRDPSPGSTDENHGTACAGVAAARGFNGLGVCGAAPNASLIGYRFLGAETSSDPLANDAVEGEVLGDAAVTDGSVVFDNREIVDVSSNSWGPTDDRHLEAPGPLAQAALQISDIGDPSGESAARRGLGTVYVWAAGNGRQANDNVNFDGYANSRFTIAVGAVTNTGKVAPYSEDGAPLMVCAPSSGGTLGVWTTDRTGADGYIGGDYYSGFSGTSAAAPLVAGVVALMLQANPSLSWLDVQQILMTTARKIDPANPDWTTNAAGYHINHSYGFGLLDAKAAVEAAKTWTPVGPETSVEASAEPNVTVPDDSTAGVSSSISLGADKTLRIDYVEVYFTAPHPSWSDLRVTLVAPSGTRSVLATSSPTDGGETVGGYTDWRFGTTRDLGESSRGTWTLKVSDLEPGGVGRFKSWRLKVYGTALAADTTPPTTSMVGTTRTWWNSSPTLHFRAVDLGSNVLRTEYRVSPSPGGSFAAGTTVHLRVSRCTHAQDGRYVVWYRSIDNAGNEEPPHAVTINVDTRAPRTYAPRAARVRRGARIRLFFRVVDPGFSSRRATVIIRIRDAGGHVRRVITLRGQHIGSLQNVLYRCRLARGAYRFSVYATDSAGNTQSRVGANALLVL
jgi:kexin